MEAEIQPPAGPALVTHKELPAVVAGLLPGSLQVAFAVIVGRGLSPLR